MKKLLDIEFEEVNNLKIKVILKHQDQSIINMSPTSSLILIELGNYSIRSVGTFSPELFILFLKGRNDYSRKLPISREIYFIDINQKRAWLEVMKKMIDKINGDNVKKELQEKFNI